MSDMLFEVPETLSLRLAWMRKHGIITFHHTTGRHPALWYAGFQRHWPDLTGIEFFAEETAHNGDSRIGEGETEDEALAALSRLSHTPLWHEEAAP